MAEVNASINQKPLPVVPMRNAVLFPGVTFPISAGRAGTLRAIEAAMASDDHKVFAVAQRSESENVSPSELYTIGTIATIGSVQRGLGGIRLVLEGKSRGIAAGDEYYGYVDGLYERVKATFARHGVPVDGKRVQLIKGLFEETWPTVDVESIALAHIDCDWYDPVKYCLKACADNMVVGGQVIVDDYLNYGGCRTAVDEFLSGRQDFRFDMGPNPILRKL